MNSFKKYIAEISKIAAQDNLTVLYKVKVEINRPKKKKEQEKSSNRKTKTKKYNVPLKKQSLKLSGFEALLRRLAEEKENLIHQVDNAPITTEQVVFNVSPKQIQLKYKPVIGIIKTNFTKRVKPVKKTVFTVG